MSTKEADRGGYERPK